MMHPKFFPISFVFVAIVTLFHLPASLAQGNELYQNCSQLFECGGIQGIGYPFWGANRPQACGHPSFSLNCTGDAPVLTIETRPYRVLAINNTTYTLKVVREAFWDNSCPQYLYNATLDETYFSYASGTGDLLLSYGCTSSLTGIIGQFTCLANGTSGTFGIYSSPSAATLANIPTGVTCTTSVIMRVDSTEAQALASSGANVTQVLNSGVGLLWQANNSNCEQCVKSGGQCGTNSSNSGSFICYCSDRDYAYACGSSSSSGGRRNLVLILGTVISTLGVLILFCIVVKKCTPSDSIFFGETKTENHRNIEAFLKNCVSLSPKRYTYSDIKKITNSFRIKLGQGGFGFVFKGELENGCLVAVKVLKGLKGNGDEFINEVATISRTSHVHIVTLLGFCFESRHKALIYEFMPKGSLDKFIHGGGSLTNHQLGWDALYQIAVGIARGLEYLHRGCNTRILHFDIKPHNILLNEDFCPKISDFGLAKLCPQKESIISLLGARGTAGYIAPEVFSRTFGGVSHKSDVYSYGMMVLEMVGQRKNNINVEVDHTSETYFPHWVYKRLELDEELRSDGITGDEVNASTRKMIIVGLWCIQIDPSHRPSMSRVLEMLEGSLEPLQIPPKPFFSSPSRAPVDPSTTQSTLMSQCTHPFTGKSKMSTSQDHKMHPRKFGQLSNL